MRLLLDVLDIRLRVRKPEAELLLLRHQLSVVRRQVKRPQLDIADRTIMAALSRRVSAAALVGMLVQPETILARHRALLRRKWVAYGCTRGPCRPRLDAEVQKLILRIANQNSAKIPGGGCWRRVDPSEFRLRALVSICRLEVSDHRKETAPSEQ